VHDLLERIAVSPDRGAAKAVIGKSGKPVYAGDPAHPGMVVQVLPDGTRRLGRMQGRRFVAAEERSHSQHR
jgi:hypothetical protein